MNPEFNRDTAHAIVSRAIDQLKKGGVTRLSSEHRDWLYRMGMVGIMAAYAASGDDPPSAVRKSLITGEPLSPKSWQKVLGEPT